MRSGEDKGEEKTRNVLVHTNTLPTGSLEVISHRRMCSS
jgi:hypothetical protein